MAPENKSKAAKPKDSQTHAPQAPPDLPYRLIAAIVSRALDILREGNAKGLNYDHPDMAEFHSGISGLSSLAPRYLPAAWEKAAMLRERLRGVKGTLAVDWPLLDWELQMIEREANFCKVPPKKPTPKSPLGDEPRLSQEAMAVALLVQYPDWSNKQIAKVVGCHVKSLSRMPRFRQARDIQADSRADRPRGSKGKDRTIEAEAEEE